ncbi:MAG: SCO family protein [Flavobacteriales bacterium]|jgi:protein SCO1/2|tara:strand:- start:4368 stop:5048 length:681 start_codon:yes stop_codon:yes gene_type:complete
MKLIKLILIISVFGQFGCGFFVDHNPRDQNKVSVTDNNGYLKEGEQLPFYGPITKEGQDTLFYQVPKFSLLDQDSLDLGYARFSERIFIVDFFFTTCSTICPIMTSELVKLQGRLYEKGLGEEIQFLSVTIDPNTDSPQVLKSYAENKGCNLNSWALGTGEIEYVDELSKEGFFLAVDRNAAYQDGIIHSSQVILIDENRHVRGSYDAVDENEMQKLLQDLIILSE